MRNWSWNEQKRLSHLGVPTRRVDSPPVVRLLLLVSFSTWTPLTTHHSLPLLPASYYCCCCCWIVFTLPTTSFQYKFSLFSLSFDVVYVSYLFIYVSFILSRQTASIFCPLKITGSIETNCLSVCVCVCISSI